MSGSTTEREHIVRDHSWEFEHKGKNYSLVEGLDELRVLREKIEKIDESRDNIFYAIGGAIVYIAGLWAALASEDNLTTDYITACVLGMLVGAWLGGGVVGFFLGEYLPQNLFLKVEERIKAKNNFLEMSEVLESQIDGYLRQRYSAIVSKKAIENFVDGTSRYFSAQVDGQFQQVYFKREERDLVLMRERKEYTVYEEV